MARNSISSGSWPDDALSTRSSLSSTSSDPISSPTTTPIIDQHQERIPWILSHVLECNLSSDLPLRIMFSFNAGHRVPTLKEAYKWWQYEPKGTAIINFLSSLEESKSKKKEKFGTTTSTAKNDKDEAESSSPEKKDHAAKDPFMDPLNKSLLDIDFASEFPNEKRASRGLPPEFIRKWCLDKVFTKAEELVDFSQALTGIDYLQDLECRRREALREVALRLKIDKNNWRKVLRADPDARKWVEDIQAQETMIESFYATCFVDLRIWTMLYELKTQPFYKPNVLAMLNTLYPPCIQELPNDLIDRDKLRKHRAKFYNFIIEVEREGTGALHDFEILLKNPECKHNWVDTRENLKDYIELACKMIEQSNAVYDIMFFKKSAGIAYRIQSAHSRSTTASSSTSTRTERQGSQNEQPAVEEYFPPGLEKPPARLHAKSITDKAQSQENSSYAAVLSSPSESRSSSRLDGESQSRKRLASPKRHHEYSQEYHTIPMNAPRKLRSVVTTPAIYQKQTFPSERPSDGDRKASVLHQHTRPRANTPFTEQNSEAAQHQSFQSWVPLKDQQQMSPFRQTSYPDPWSRGPPNPKYQLRPKNLSEDEKLLQAMRQSEAPIKRRASFPNGDLSSSSRARASSVNSTKFKSCRMHQDSDATSFNTLRAGSTPYVSQQSSLTTDSPRTHIEKVLKNHSDAIQAYQALDLRELPGYPSILKTIAPDSTPNPQLRTQKSYNSSGDLRGRAMSGFTSIPGSPLSSQQGTPVEGASRKLQLRKTPLRDSATDTPMINPSSATSDSRFTPSQTTPTMTTPRIKLRKMPLYDPATKEMQTPSPSLSNPRSPLPLRQESPITPTPGILLRKTALQNSSIEVQTRNASLSLSRSPLPSPLNSTTPSPRTDVRQKSNKLTKQKPPNELQCDSTPGSVNKNMNPTTGGHLVDTPMRKPILPELSPNANFSFLNSPYEPPEEIQPRLRKKSSMATIFRRKSCESLKSVRFEEPGTSHDNASPKTPRKSSESSKSVKYNGATSINNALGISIPGAQSKTVMSQVSAADSFTDFPPPPPPRPALKKQKSLGLFLRRDSEPVNDSVNLPPRPLLKKQKSLGLFPRKDGGKEKDRATPSAPTSKSQDMGSIFDGSQHACTAYYAHTVTVCREPYKFPIPPTRTPIPQDSVPKPYKSPATPMKTPIIHDSILKPRPVVRINAANRPAAISNASPISPDNKVFGFIPPPLTKQTSFGGWETDLDIALEHERRLKSQHAKAQAQNTSMRHRASPGLSIDTMASNDLNSLRKTTSKLSKTASFADDSPTLPSSTPSLPASTPGSTKLGSFFMNAGANISAIFVGKSASNTPDPNKSPKVPVPSLSKKDGKERSAKNSEAKVTGRRDRSGSKYHIPFFSSSSFLIPLKTSANASLLPHSPRLHHPQHQPLAHFQIPSRVQKFPSTQKLPRAQTQNGDAQKARSARSSPVESYSKYYEALHATVLAGGFAEGGASGGHCLVRWGEAVCERVGGAVQEEGVFEGVFVGERLGRGKWRGGNWMGGRDTRRRVFEEFVSVGGRRVERVVQKVDWRREGWFEVPRARVQRVERGERGEREVEAEVQPKMEEEKKKKKKYVMISTAKYDKY
ncbi:hypothetical protein SBOR_1784 [Sclerotinia borealis F-4128]|uniref:Uncharacterized protein n=1 Tax=Sclerotinia borealis (strain F-4128) TaxID=1432307 RepID=W9CTG2_SCLBF|nr:hypothetical protein SBOR_1784 [Sclerotinia borealis F-4128]